MAASISDAVLLTAIMAFVIFFCRVCPFLFFRGKKPDGNDSETGDSAKADRRMETFIIFIEKIVPPLAMTVLAFNALSVPVFESVKQGSLVHGCSVLIAAAVTVIVHLWRRNALFSIFSGTAVYMILERVVQ